MRISKGVLVLLAGLTAANVAWAQEEEGTGTISPEKRAPLLELVPTAYGKIDLQQRTYRSYNTDGSYAGSDPFAVFHPILGATFFNDHVDSAFHWYFTNTAGSNRVTKYAAYNETQWNWFTGKFNKESPWSFGPYSYVDMMGAGVQGYDYADLGFYGEVNYQFPIKSGAIALQFSEQPLVEVAPNSSPNYSSGGPGEYNPTHSNNMSNKAAEGIGLVDQTNDNGDITAHQKDYTYLNYASVSAKYIPAALPALSIGVGVIATSYWFPTYDVYATSEKLRAYSPQQYTTNRVVLSYNVNDKVTISEQLRYYKGGYDTWSITQQRQDQTNWVGPYSWENRVGLTATLF